MTKRRRKHYRDLSLDEPLPHDPTLDAEVEAMTPEQLDAMIEEAWFTNPGGHFRRRILRKYERNGLIKLVKMPDGRAGLLVADLSRLPPDVQQKCQSAITTFLDLFKAVEGELDEPYDPERTRADYGTETSALRLAKPHLVCCVESKPVEHGDEKFDLNREMCAPKWCVPHINTEGDSNWGELIEDGFDASGKVGLGLVYYRHVVRAGEMVGLSTFMASRDQVVKIWGPSGLDYCDPITGTAAARIEMKIPKGVDMQNGDYNTVLVAAEMVFVKTYERRLVAEAEDGR